MKRIQFQLNTSMTSDKSKLLNYPTPISGQEDIPKWWRDGEPFLNKRDQSANVKNKEDRIAGMKGCMPFLDAITSGYLILLWRSVEVAWDDDNNILLRQVVKDENGVWVEDPAGEEYKSIGIREGDLGHTMPRPAGYNFTHLAWVSPWGVKSPKGWSVLVTHPLNRFELPFITTSGIIESDNFSANGNFPFFIKDGWSGVIEAGTPIAQMIPIKRSSWISENKFGLSKKTMFYARAARSVDYGFYRSNSWVKKIYKTKDMGKINDVY